MSSTPIAEHALLSDRHSAALVSRDGSVEWLCFPRFDSPSVFARLLDDAAGHWFIRPIGGADISRRYLDQTMVLETTFHSDDGSAVLVDALATGMDNQGHRLGVDAPHLLIREITCTRGEVDLEIEYLPRPEYGLVVPLLSTVDGGVTARGGAEWLVLSTPVRLTLDRSAARGAVTLRAGDVLRFGLHRSTLEEIPARVWSQRELGERLAATVKAWRSWSDLHQAYEGFWRDLVHHSGRVLQALSFQPSGAIVAAATTSLPEGVGGERNWDYRFSWVRDASFTMEALWVAACPDEAVDFFAFMTTAGATSAGAERRLQIMFGIGGEHDLTERILPHLRGWRESRPVRIGNGAWNQQQIDVYGELLGAAHRLADQLTNMDQDTRSFLVGLADTAAVRWRETDQGIWEVRGEPRHFLYSKVMCWVALDRAIKLAPLLGANGKVGDWKHAQEEIWQTVVAQGRSSSSSPTFWKPRCRPTRPRCSSSTSTSAMGASGTSIRCEPRSRPSGGSARRTCPPRCVSGCWRPSGTGSDRDRVQVPAGRRHQCLHRFPLAASGRWPGRVGRRAGRALPERHPRVPAVRSAVLGGPRPL